MLSLEYAKLVGKKKAKSKVWTHFGFPADDDGTILQYIKIKLSADYARLLYRTQETLPT